MRKRNLKREIFYQSKKRKSFYLKGNTMRVYITDLSAYNNGHLIGSYFELPMSVEDLSKGINDVLANGSKVCNDGIHEEWFITDHEGFPMSVGEYSDVFKLNEIAEKMEGLDDREIKIVEFLLGDNIVKDIDEAIEHIEDIVLYEDTTMEDIAEEYVNNSIDIDSLPELVRYHIDYEGIGRDLRLNGNYYEDKENGDIYEVCF